MKPVFQSTKVIELGSCAFRQWRANHSMCRFLHGYQLKAKLWFSCSSLDDKNWAVDFGGLKELKAELNSIYDHTTTIAADDPELDTFKSLHDKGIIQLYILKDGAGVERVAENVFTIADKHVRELTNNRCWLDKVEVFEHENNSAIYTAEQVVIKPYNFKASISSTNIDGNITLDTRTAITDHISLSNATISTSHVDNTTSQATNDRGASIGNKVSQGMGNPFAGTTWSA